ncbi:DUF6777 domain-containing protein [Streptomyces sp. NPDC048269]|uniref:DUF6777 domain-containing protein n=1 Tax=Streptomyces sp. NPDC048269 TaxID=3155753 RepID=UPI0034437ECC
MTTEPLGTPPPDRPTGPPSGPLSGDRQGAPPPPPPPPPPGGSGGYGSGSGPHDEPGRKPWWRSAPRLVTALVAVAAAVALALVLTRPSGTPGQGSEVFLQPAGSAGQDPFTESTARTQSVQEPQPAPSSAAPATATTATRSVSGAQPGLYGGTQDLASCDVEKQIKVLAAAPVKNSAFASALGIQPGDVDGYLRSLTPVDLRLDTRVTNHGYKDGAATGYQAVLQAGTAVLVDDRGVPRVRCACGNPLGQPVPLKPGSKRYGQPWAAYRPQNVVVIAPSVTIVNKIVIYDHANHRWYQRDRGAKPERDKPVAPPVASHPPVTTLPPVTSPEASGTSTPTDQHTGTPSEETGTPSEDTGTPSEETGTPSEDTEVPTERLPVVPTGRPLPGLTDGSGAPRESGPTTSEPAAPTNPSAPPSSPRTGPTSPSP